MNNAFAEQEEIAAWHVTCWQQRVLLMAQLVRLRAAGWKGWVGGRKSQSLEQEPRGRVPKAFLISFLEKSAGSEWLTSIAFLHWSGCMASSKKPT